MTLKVDFVVAMLFAVTVFCEAINSSRPILFIDEFNGNSLNRSLWQVQTGHDMFGANRSMCFRDHPDNIKVANGKLIIKAIVKDVLCPKKVPARKQFTSARVKTIVAYDFTALEFKSRMTKCEHCQPGLWSQKSDSTVYEEIDDIEVKGMNTREYYVNSYYGKTLDNLINKKPSHRIKVNKDLSEGFHTFVVEKTSDKLKFYFDGEEKHSMERGKYDLRNSSGTKIPFSDRMHVIISLLIGGDWFNREPRLTAKIGKKWRKSTLEIDRVVVYG